MGLDLTLLPVDYLSRTQGPRGERIEGYSHTVLNPPRDSRIHDAILGPKAVVPTQIIPEGADITTHTAGRGKYGRIKKDAYGDAYTWALAGDLAKVLRRYARSSPTTAYIAALPPTTLVILDWH